MTDTDALECDPYEVAAEGDMSAFDIEADSPEAAIETFWEGVSDREELVITAVDGIDIKCSIHPDSVVAEIDRDGMYVVDVDVTVQTVLNAPTEESAVEQFQIANNNAPYLELELPGGVGVSLKIDINDTDASER